MNHCLTYKSLACLHRLCVMTTSGMAGWGLRKCWESVCVRESACVNKSQIRYQQGSWSVSAAGKTPNRRLPNTSEPGLLGGWQEGPQKKASRRSSNACARVCVCEWVCLRREVVVGKCVRKLVLLTWRGLWFRRHYGSHCFFFFFLLRPVPSLRPIGWACQLGWLASDMVSDSGWSTTTPGWFDQRQRGTNNNSDVISKWAHPFHLKSMILSYTILHIVISTLYWCQLEDLVYLLDQMLSTTSRHFNCSGRQPVSGLLPAE